MAKFNVLSPVNHDGMPYTEGDEIELDDKVAAPLLELNVIEAPSAEVAENPDPENLGDGGDANQSQTPATPLGDGQAAAGSSEASSPAADGNQPNPPAASGSEASAPASSDAAPKAAAPKSTKAKKG